MGLLFKIFVLVGCLKSLAQKEFKDTIWFDKKWNECDKQSAFFYRVYSSIEKGFVIYDKYLDGKLQMYSEAREIRPLIKDGYTVYYNENGFKASRGYNKDNKNIGIWTLYFDNERDSSVYEILSDGIRKYIRKSNLQKEDIYTIVETPSEFPGGIQELIKFIQTNLKYPESARELALGGKVFLKFVVNEDGNIDNIEVLKGSGHNEMDEEAIRVVKLMPKWKPASMTGKNVKCYFNLPISYSLDEPFYTFNVTSKNESYRKITQLIFDGKWDEAYAIIDNLNVDSKDSDLLYNKAVLLFNLKKRREACDCFISIVETTDVKGSLYNNSNKFYKKYCN